MKQGHKRYIEKKQFFHHKNEANLFCSNEASSSTLVNCNHQTCQCNATGVVEAEESLIIPSQTGVGRRDISLGRVIQPQLVRRNSCPWECAKVPASITSFKEPPPKASQIKPTQGHHIGKLKKHLTTEINQSTELYIS